MIRSFLDNFIAFVHEHGKSAHIMLLFPMKQQLLHFRTDCESLEIIGLLCQALSLVNCKAVLVGNTQSDYVFMRFSQWNLVALSTVIVQTSTDGI